MRGLIPARTLQGSDRASGHGGGMQAALSGGVIIREGSSSLAARATSPTTSERRTPGAPEGALDPRGKLKRKHSPSPVQVESSPPSPPSSSPPHLGDTGQECSAAAEARATLGRPSSPKLLQILRSVWRFASSGSRLGFANYVPLFYCILVFLVALTHSSFWSIGARRAAIPHQGKGFSRAEAELIASPFGRGVIATLPGVMALGATLDAAAEQDLPLCLPLAPEPVEPAGDRAGRRHR
jgi:hypothetical protein